jgi:general secretion pathway protein K
LHIDDFQFEAAERSGVELAVARLLAAPAKQRPGRDVFEVRIGEASIGADISSEAGRLDLNNAPARVLAKLFARLGADEDASQKLARATVKWRQRAEGDDDTAARHALYQDARELSLVGGMPADLAAAALPYITVFGGADGIDVRSASPLLLSALPDVDDDRLARVLKARENPAASPETLLAPLGPSAALASVAPALAWRVALAIRLRDGRAERAEFVVLPTPDEAEPYRVLSRSGD